MNDLMLTALFTFIGTISFICLASPTVRKEIKEYFDLQSERRKKLKEEETTN